MKGIDISNLNETVNIASVKSAGYGFIISKITEGCTFIDKYGRQNVANTKSNGLIAGAYHFARFMDKDRAIEEAEFFKANCPSNVDFVVLDFEQQCHGDMTDACLAFLDIISSIAPALIYCNPNYINLYLNFRITKYPLWIAHYGVSSPSVPKWGSYAIWQYSEYGSVPGVSGNVDLNVSGPNFNFKQNENSAAVQESSGSITSLQSELNSMINANLVVDGISGLATTAAVENFQNLMGLQADGIAGDNTWNAINQIRSYLADGVNYPHYEYATRWIQWRVGTGIDGIFGSGTEAKVKEFQQKVNSDHGEKLSVDGIVGKETWRCMFEY
ncbi:GH25 family lysozyme [Clostridium neuense]|uniref:GH25 family lysozyme n=1 Tax=Clostridium neuense TaxID=1728934 RepID=A0ABW8T8M5_9CLOT